MKRVVVIVLILMSALSLSACGGDEGSETTSPSEWANSLCTDLSQWESSVAAVTASFEGGNLSQEQVQNAANDVADATETLVGNLQRISADPIQRREKKPRRHSTNSPTSCRPASARSSAPPTVSPARPMSLRPSPPPAQHS